MTGEFDRPQSPLRPPSGADPNSGWFVYSPTPLFLAHTERLDISIYKDPFENRFILSIVDNVAEEGDETNHDTVEAAKVAASDTTGLVLDWEIGPHGSNRPGGASGNG